MRPNILAGALVVILLSMLGGCGDDATAPRRDSGTSSTGEIEPGTPIEDSYLVVLKGGPRGGRGESLATSRRRMRGTAEAILEDNGIAAEAVDRVFVRVLGGFSAWIPAEQAVVLARDPRVAYVEQDMVMAKGPGGGDTEPSEPIPATVPWGIARIGGGVDYAGSNVAWVLDTGIDLDNADLNVDVARSVNIIDSRDSADDDNGHGTFVAGIIAAIDNEINVVGVAAGATVVPVKVLDRRGSGATSGVIEGIDYVAAHAAAGDVVNLSLVGSPSDALDAAVIAASAGGVYFALAAGNDGQDADDYSPSRVNGPYIYTASAMDSNDDWAFFSNYGNPPVDFCTPGVDILSLTLGGGTVVSSGTSAAAPHLAGLLLSTAGAVNSDGTVNGDPDGVPDPIAHR